MSAAAGAGAGAAAGDVIEVRWKRDGRYYPARVTRVCADGSVDAVFVEDGIVVKGATRFRPYQEEEDEDDEEDDKEDDEEDGGDAAAPAPAPATAPAPAISTAKAGHPSFIGWLLGEPRRCRTDEAGTGSRAGLGPRAWAAARRGKMQWE